MAKKPRKPTAVEKKLVGVADLVIAAAEKRKDPTIAIPVRSLSNVNFNERKGLIEMGKRKQARSFFNVAMAKKFMQTVLVADALSELQRANLTTSLREIYYRTKHTIKDSHENTLDTQDESDPLIEDLEVTLTALREELHVRAENAGSIVGPVVFVDDGDRVDCTRLGKGGYSVPSIVEPEYLQIARCTADFVLLVEKGTQWNRLSEAKFMGLSSADPEACGLPRNVGIKLNDKDVARARELLAYTWFQKKSWQEEIKRMLSSGLKYELDALANKDFQYLTKKYLPRKLKEKDWLD